MPAINEQMVMLGSQTNPVLTAARFLLRPGRKYAEAVKTFDAMLERVTAQESAGTFNP